MARNGPIQGPEGSLARPSDDEAPEGAAGATVVFEVEDIAAMTDLITQARWQNPW